MIDRETGTVWTHLDGNAITGPLQGARLKMIPTPQMTWSEWRSSHPNTLVLSPETSFKSRYRNVPIGAFNPREARFGDERLPSNALVVGVEVNGHYKGYRIEDIEKVGGVVNDVLGGQPVVVIYDRMGQTGIDYSRTVDGLLLDFYNSSIDGFELRDRQTQTVWNDLGVGISGETDGQHADFVPSFISEWYGWSAYHPETTIYRPGQ